jgi:hypothetical protein
MQWEKSAVDKMDELLQVVREPFRSIIKSNSQAHAENYAMIRGVPHVSTKEAVLGFLRARSHKINQEGLMLLEEFKMNEEDFRRYPSSSISPQI